VSGSWICLLIRSSTERSDLFEETSSIFGDDLVDFVVVEIPSTEDGEIESNYGFVKCSNYYDHVDKLKRSSLVTGVLPSYESPSLIDDSEIQTFRKSSIKEKKKPSTFKKGDIVQIRRGYLRNLTGVVAEELVCKRYRVIFQLFTKKFSSTLHASSMIFVGNLFDTYRRPILCYGSEGSEGRIPVKKLAACAVRAFLCRVKRLNSAGSNLLSDEERRNVYKGNRKGH